ncbi:MAG: hypothetical protein AABZ71_05010, partial [Candidatus Binatota bacterium]
SHLERVRPLEISPGSLKIGVEERYHYSYLQDPENLSSLKDLACRFFAVEVTVGVAPIAISNQVNKDEATNHIKPAKDGGDEMVTEALRIFGGSIKGIKRESG